MYTKGKKEFVLWKRNGDQSSLSFHSWWSITNIWTWSTDLKEALMSLHVGPTPAAFKMPPVQVHVDWWELASLSWMTTVANVPWVWLEHVVNILCWLPIYFPQRLQSKRRDLRCWIMPQLSPATAFCITMTNLLHRSKSKTDSNMVVLHQILKLESI